MGKGKGKMSKNRFSIKKTEIALQYSQLALMDLNNDIYFLIILFD